MISMDNYLLKLYKEGTITKDTAIVHASNPELLTRRLI